MEKTRIKLTETIILIFRETIVKNNKQHYCSNFYTFNMTDNQFLKEISKFTNAKINKQVTQIYTQTNQCTVTKWKNHSKEEQINKETNK